MEPTTEMTFKSEEERLAAIEAIGDDPSKEGELDNIMSAKIVAGNEADPGEGQDIVDPNAGPDQVDEPEQDLEADPNRDPVAGPEGVELPEKFKNWGEFLKSYKESQELIERQGRKIEELVSQKPEPVPQERPVQREPQERRAPEFSQPQSRKSRLDEIRALRAELRQAAKDPEARFEQEYLEKRERLDDLLIDEVEYSQGIAHEASESARRTGESYEQYMQRMNAEQRAKQHEQAWKSEVEQIDSFLQKPDVKSVYPLSKSYGEVDRDYIDWSNRVAAQYYGRPARGNEEVAHAMAQLQTGSPTLIDKCRTANIPTEPDQDIKSYLEICDLQDFQDGIRVDPTTGKRVQAMRYDPQLGREVPDRFPSIEAAYNHRLVSSGHFKEQVAKARQAGGKQVLDAISRRDSGVVEMGAQQQASGAQEMSNQQAAQVLDSIDPEAAMQQARMGDSSQLDKINKAMQALGIDPTKT